MENSDSEHRDFFVALPELAGMKIFTEVNRAFRLYWWCMARITIEYEHGGERIGAVLGFCPVTDQRIAADVSRYGAKCSERTVRRWRKDLEERGLIACLRTPIGHRIMVIGSEKFQSEDMESLPGWAIEMADQAKYKLRSQPKSSFGQPAKFGRSTGRIWPVNRQDLAGLNKETKEETNKGQGQPDFSPLADEEEELCFDSPYLKVTYDQDEALQREFESLRLDFPAMQQEYDKAVAWIKSQPNPEPARNSVAFMRKWLSGSRRFTQPPVETHPDHRGKPGWDTELNIPLAERPF